MRTRWWFALLLGTVALFPSREEHIAKAAEALQAKLIALRRDFHMHPEVSNREEGTARIITKKLRGLGLEVRSGVAKHGIVAVLKGSKPGPVVAWRADMDALPVTSTINTPYKSRNEGVHHACGYYAHIAIGLTVAELLSGMRDDINGSVKFIFQPAEDFLRRLSELRARDK